MKKITKISILLLAWFVLLVTTGCQTKQEQKPAPQPSQDALSSTAPSSESSKPEDRNAIRTEEEILADLQEEGIPYEAENAVITDLEIIKRQTNEAQMTDKVWVTLQANNEKVSYVRSYCIVYTLYNDGWLFDTAQEDYDAEHSTTPLAGPDEEIIDQLFLSYNDSHQIYVDCPPYSSWEITDLVTDLDTRSARFYIAASRETPILRTVEEIEIDCIFGKYWYIVDADIPSHIQSATVDWDKLVNTWSDSNDLKELTITISAIDENSITLDCYCKRTFSDTTSHWSGTFPITNECPFGFPTTRNHESLYFVDFTCPLDDTFSLEVTASYIAVLNSWGDVYEMVDLESY